MCIRPCKDGVMINIQIIPNSKKDGFKYDEESERLRVWTSKPTLKGRANKEILKKFSKIFGNCEIISGKLSRKKTILIKGRCVDEVERILR